MSIFNIPIDQPFLATLAKGILERFGGEPLGLARVEVLLPNRRSCRAFTDVLLKTSGQPSLILPKIQAIGDVEEDLALDPALTKPRRLLLYSEKITAWFYARSEKLPRSAAFSWAEKLCSLQDECERYSLSLQDLNQVFPEDVAAHRETLLSLLAIVMEEQAQTQEARRNQLLKQKAEQLRTATHPIIAAGSLGTIPATAHLLKTIAQLPQGFVVLPGLDAQCGNAPRTHPQYGLQRLIGFLSISKDSVLPFSSSCDLIAGSSPKSPLDPAIKSQDDASIFVRHWMQVPFHPRAMTPPNRLYVIEADTGALEAGAIAVALRETLETPGKTAMLVTPDRTLARQVSALLRQWEVEVDDSAGSRLSHTPLGGLLILILDAAAEPQSALALLPLLKHPLCIFSRHEARELEQDYFRKQRKPAGAFYEKVQEALAPLRHLLQQHNPRTPIVDLLDAHLEVLKRFTAAEARPETEQVEAAVRELREAASELFVPAAEYPGLLRQLFAQYQYRPAYGTHPRLSILSPMEARLMTADRVIIGSLNDTAWPGSPSEDWLGARARKQLGLPQHEDAISHAAHDFTQLLGAKELILTRAHYSQGTPQNPHPWLIRLKALCTPHAAPWLDWAHHIVMPQAPLQVPAPCPPLSARPKKLSATDIRDLMQQPYRYYAKKILQLAPLDPLSRESADKDIGSALHKAFEEYTLTYPHHEPLKTLSQLITERVKPILASPAEWALWQTRIPLIAAQFLEWDEAERAVFPHVFPEIKGSIMVGEIEVHAKADRIAMDELGEVMIVDYKTGGIPDKGDIIRGHEPQLLIEKAIAAYGGYNTALSTTSAPRSAALQYWKISSSETRAEQQAAPDIAADMIHKQLESLLYSFFIRDLPFGAIPMDYKNNPDPFAHLARIEEAFFR